MKRAGYYTAIVGKQPNYVPEDAFGWDRNKNETADNWDDTSDGYWSMWRSPEGLHKGTKELEAEAAKQNKPFFLHLNTSDPHRPWPGSVDEVDMLKGLEKQFGTRVPLIMHWPKGIRGGRKVNTLVNGVDVMPTILNYSGLSIPSQCQGESLRRFVEGREDMNRAAFCEATHPTAQVMRRMIRTQDWKLWIYYQKGKDPNIWTEGRPMAVYYLSEDPGEQHNLASDPAYAKTRKALTDRMISWMESTEDPLLSHLPALA